MNRRTLCLTGALATCVPAVLSAAEQPYRVGAAFIDCPDCPEMVVVPPGSDVVGSTPEERKALGVDARFDTMEAPRHKVTIGYKLAVGRYAVTFAQWDACVADGGCGAYRPDDAGWGRGRQPVINVNFAQAEAYVAWLKAKTGQPYRLLSEAEWEHAARAGTTGWWFFAGPPTPDRANYGGTVGRTAPVGSYPANPWGLYDMGGNTAQWVEDCYHDSYVGAPTDGSAWIAGADCKVRNVRGGGWSLSGVAVRVAQRIGDPVERFNTHLGFRVARNIPQ